MPTLRSGLGASWVEHMAPRGREQREAWRLLSSDGIQVRARKDHLLQRWVWDEVTLEPKAWWGCWMTGQRGYGGPRAVAVGKGAGQD